MTFGKATIERAAIDLEDRVPQPVVKLGIRDLSFTAANYSNARNAKSTASLRGRVGERGRVAWNGPLATNPVSFAGQLDVSGVDLVTVRPYVESRVNVSLTAGALAAKGNVALDVPEGAPVKAGWNGRRHRHGLRGARQTDGVRPRCAGSAWRSKTWTSRRSPSASSSDGSAPRTTSRALIVYEDGTLEFRAAADARRRNRSPPPRASPLPRPPTARPRHEPLPISIGRIELANGNVNYLGLLRTPELLGEPHRRHRARSTTMSAEQAGDIAITARVDHTAPVEVSGRIHPFAKELSLDIAAKARDVDLPPLTPYAVKYAGYGIEKGKLTFDVHYRVENRKLAAENRLVLDQLTFNRERIDSPTATKLPVLLAVSLLKDSRGVIDINLPIAGSLDDPEFSVGGLIIRVIVNLITKAVDRAVRAAGRCVRRTARSCRSYRSRQAVPCSMRTHRGASTRWPRRSATGPRSSSTSAGAPIRQADREALRHAAVEIAMKHEKMKSLVASGEAPASVDLVTIGADERVRWLTAAYKESSIKDRPRNAIGLLKDLPPAEMEAMLLAEAKVDDDALRLLANARAQAVKDDLASKNIATERLFLTVPRVAGVDAAPSATAAPASPATPIGAPPTRVDLALR